MTPIWAYVFWPYLSHFWANWAEIFIIYRLVMGKPSYNAQFSFSIFRATVGGQNGRGHHGRS